MLARWSLSISFLLLAGCAGWLGAPVSGSAASPGLTGSTSQPSTPVIIQTNAQELQSVANTAGTVAGVIAAAQPGTPWGVIAGILSAAIPGLLSLFIHAQTGAQVVAANAAKTGSS
jgi:hypothetical protein